MENNPCREDIANRLTFGRHIFDINDFRCNKARSTTSNKKVFLFVSMSSKAKIADCQIIRFISPKDDVFRFQIAMNYPVVVEMSQSLENILDYLFDIV